MGNGMRLFTLHESEKDFRIIGAVIAQSYQEAASTFGGEFVKVEGMPVVSSTDIDRLGLCGKIKFAKELFRDLSGKEIGQIGHDPGPCYEREGFLI